MTFKGEEGVTDRDLSVGVGDGESVPSDDEGLPLVDRSFASLNFTRGLIMDCNIDTLCASARRCLNWARSYVFPGKAWTLAAA